MKITPEIAYDTGAHVGDGNMYSYYKKIFRITYCGNLSNEKNFYIKFQKLLTRIYGVKPILLERKKDNTIVLVVNSRKIFEFKRDFLKLPVGKKDHVEIPEIILNNKNLLKYFMRGLGDTDFSLSFKKNRKGVHTEPRLEFYTKSNKLARQVFDVLKDFKFTCVLQEVTKTNGFIIRMYGNKNLKNWMNNFGFFNDWILIKLKVWKKLGYFPIRRSFSELKNML